MIKLSIILEWLSEVKHTVALTPRGDKNPGFSDVRIYHEKLPERKADVLYISYDTPLPEDGNHNIFTVCSPHTSREDCNCIVVNDDVTQAQLYDLLRNCMLYYQNWLSSLDQALLAGGDMQRLLDLSEDIFQNPVIFTDSYYNYVAGSNNITQDEPFYHTLKVRGKADPELIYQIFSEVDVDKTGYLSNGSEYWISDRVLGKTELFCDYKVDGYTVNCMNMRCSKRPFSHAIIDLVDLFYAKLDYLFRHSSNETRRICDIDYLMLQVIEGADLQAVAKVLDLPLKGKYVVICFDEKQVHNSDKVAFSRKLHNIVPDSKVFTYNDHLFMLILFSERRSAELYQSDQLDIVLEARKTFCGMSNVFRSLSQTKHACIQALKTIELEELAKKETSFIPPTRPGRVLHYSSVEIYHIVETFFGMEQWECYLPSNFAKMAQDDRDNASNNCDILKTYLLNDRKLTVTAQKLYMHRNNVIYRLNKIKENYHINYDDNMDRLLFLFCCIAHDYLSE